VRLRRSLSTLRSELARVQVQAQACAYDAALSSVRPTGCALHGASLFLVWPRKSNQKEGHPCIRVLLRKTPLPPAPLRGPSRRDIHVPSLLARHPCLASSYAAPTLGLLKGNRVRGVWRSWNSDSNKALPSDAGSVGRKTAKHFPPQSTQRLVPNFANENRWVSFALPTLRRALTTASLHALSDTTESPLSRGRAHQLVGWVQPIKLLRWASPILRFVDPSPVQPHSRSRPLPQGRVLLPQGGVLECQQPSAPSSLGTSQLLGTAQPTAKQRHPVGAVLTAKLLSSQQKHRSAGQNLKPNQTHPGTTHSPNRGQDHSHSVRHRYPSARPTTAAVHLFKKALQPCA